MTVFAHRLDQPTGIEDLSLGPPLIRWVDLGPRRSAPARLFRPGPDVARIRALEPELDVLFIQGPSPLLPHLVKACRTALPVLLVWGDYGEWRGQADFPWWRNIAIRSWMTLYTFLQRRAARGRVAFIQNPLLSRTVAGAEIDVVPFSTVSRADLETHDPVPTNWPPERGSRDPVRLLYAGRIVRDKGVFEAVRVVRTLKDKGISVSLELIGWMAPNDPIGHELPAFVAQLGLKGDVHFGGYVPAGPELLARYRAADIFLLPTYWDSLPRAMQEAMAVGLPVVTTPVGGIGHQMRDGETALLVPPRDASALAYAVERLIRDRALRARVAENGRRWSLQHSIEADTESIFGKISSILERRPNTHDARRPTA